MSEALPILKPAAEAVALGGGDLCAAGHDWTAIGGRPCPRARGTYETFCSQAVYKCTRCGAIDDGEPGGPGYDDCMRFGPCDPSCVQEDA